MFFPNSTGQFSAEMTPSLNVMPPIIAFIEYTPTTLYGVPFISTYKFGSHEEYNLSKASVFNTIVCSGLSKSVAVKNLPCSSLNLDVSSK